MSNLVSPCVRNCCLDNQDVCLGCGRTLQEITGWRAMTDEQRSLIMERLSTVAEQDELVLVAATDPVV